MQLSRFERRILGAITAVAVVPLVGALLLGRQALVEAYEVGVNQRVRNQLEEHVALYRTQFETLRNDADRTADAIAESHALHEVLEAGDVMGARRVANEYVERYPAVARIAISDPSGHEIARVEREERLDEEELRLLDLERPVGPEGALGTAVVTVATPAAPFHAQQRAADILEVFTELEESSGYVSGSYLTVYIGFLLSVIALAVGLGVFLARRVTRRVSVLAEATRRVGAGDLTVLVPTDTADEVGELTGAFNDMVKDIRESRGRIDYLQRISAWQDFARRLAHEIKNPLTPIQLAVQEVHRTYDGSDEKYRRRLEDARAIVEEEIATLRRLVGEFSAFAKLPEAQLAPADLRDFVRDASRTIGADESDAGEGAEEEAQRLEIELEVDDQPMPVKIDAMMLKRCLDNLARNAMHAARAVHPERGGRVIVAARRQKTEVVLEVRDNGAGVPADKRARVFDPYYTTKAEGTGLGLAIVKKVILEHQGEIEVLEAPEGGATFRIRLPIAKERAK